MDDSGLYPVELRSSSLEGWVALPAGTAAEVAIAMMLAGGAWVARPAIAAPTVTRSAEGWVIEFAAPDGAVCDVVDPYLGWLGSADASAGALAFVLADAGRYQLEVTAPRPWLGRTDNLVLA
jgi:hypothetical protein